VGAALGRGSQWMIVPRCQYRQSRRSLAISVIKWQQAIDMLSFSGFAWGPVGVVQPIQISISHAAGSATLARGARLIAMVRAWIVLRADVHRRRSVTNRLSRDVDGFAAGTA
jgi:hypothetical protein